MAKTQRKTKTLNNHRKLSGSLSYNLRKTQSFSNREPKKQKNKFKSSEQTWDKNKNFTLDDIRIMFPNLHLKDALQELFESRRKE